MNEPRDTRSNLTDEEDLSLVRRTREGETEAFGTLVTRHQKRIYALAYRMTGNHAAADDIAQETFVRAFRGIGDFGGRSSFYTWIYRIAVNLALTRWKKARTHPELELDPEILERFARRQPSRPEGDGDRGARSRELGKAIDDALAVLSPEHRAVVVMREMEGMPHQEIARICGCSEGTVRSRLFYAKKMLRKKLMRYL
ncbi:MAG: sigma-70 family RNA polymerase sigma factor [Candidatus Aureabacteria bacterium]|nr:sigma-70 family RNA polymerase sigma factor [Candidatus Auribacterota bacterium]